MKRVSALLFFPALVVFVASCATLPPPRNRHETTAVTDTAQTRLGRSVARFATAHPGKTGAHGLPNPYDAFAVRMVLAGAAEKSIDAQYYIWNGDSVGNLLFEALWKAAERGVRVRLLVDDGNTSGLDAVYAVFDAHPNIEVRLYNPFTSRGSRTLSMLTDFGRLNRRMHNKSFTVDNQVSVVGGRNIADDYYGASQGLNFADMDALLLGAAVGAVSKEFDTYWNSASAYPAGEFVGPPGNDGIANLLARFAAVHADPKAQDYLNAVRQTSLLTDLRERKLAFEPVDAQVIYDDPAKTLDTSNRSDVLMLPELIKRMGQPSKELDIVSAYFVPGDQGTATLTALAKQGVRVRILTNSLASSGGSVALAGYIKRRVDLLKAGVELWEIKPTASKETLKREDRFGSSEVSGLHAKSYAVDRARIFIGSFNFDPRSAELNTEMGVFIDSPPLAGLISTRFDDEFPFIAYEVRLAADGNSLQWIERMKSGEQKQYDVDPETSATKRFGVRFLSVLPIEWML